MEMALCSPRDIKGPNMVKEQRSRTYKMMWAKPPSILDVGRLSMSGATCELIDLSEDFLLSYPSCHYVLNRSA